MVCYKDKQFCPFFRQCKVGYKCDRALTFKVKIMAKDARKFVWEYKEKPDCFI